MTKAGTQILTLDGLRFDAQLAEHREQEHHFVFAVAEPLREDARSGVWAMGALSELDAEEMRRRNFTLVVDFAYGSTVGVLPGILGALDIETGERKWEVPQIGTADSWGGVLSTAGGIVFFGEDSGACDRGAEAGVDVTQWNVGPIAGSASGAGAGTRTG